MSPEENFVAGSNRKVVPIGKKPRVVSSLTITRPNKPVLVLVMDSRDNAALYPLQGTVVAVISQLP